MEHAAAIQAGELEAMQKSSVEFIIKASGIKQRYVYVKEGILDIERMHPAIPERPEDSLSNQAEIALHAARNAMKAANKNAADIDAVIVSALTPSVRTPPLPLRCKTNWESRALASTCWWPARQPPLPCSGDMRWWPQAQHAASC